MEAIVQGLVQRIEFLAALNTAAQAEHAQVHGGVTSVQAAVTGLNAIAVAQGRDLAVIKGTVTQLNGQVTEMEKATRDLKEQLATLQTGGTGAASVDQRGRELRARLDKMVEAKTNIQPYASISSSAQSCKEFLEDLRDHIGHYDGQLASALGKVMQT